MTKASSRVPNLLRPNNSSGDITDGCVNNFVSFFESISLSCNVYLITVDEASCCLLIMLGDGLRCKLLGDDFFLSVWIRCYYRKYFRGHFLIIIKRKGKKNLPGGGIQEVLKYLNVWFRQTTPINQKRSIRNLPFYLSSNSFPSLLSQRSNFVHSSLHLVTQVYQPRPVSALSVSCQSS